MRHVSSFNLVALLGIASALSLLVCVVVFTGHMDRQQAAREQKLLETRADADLAAGQASVQGWARNDEAVRRLDHARDTEWAATAFPNLSGSNVATYTFDAADTFISGRHAAPTASARLRGLEAQLPARIAALRRAPGFGGARGRGVASDFFWFRGTLYVLIAAPFTPASPLIALKGAAAPVLAALTTYENFLRVNLAGTGLKQLRVVAAAGGGRTIRDLRGRAIASVTWQADRPGAVFRRVVLLPAAALCAAFVSLLIFAHRRASIERRKLIESERRASHLAFHDQLTGLANRRLLLDTMAAAIARAEQPDRGLALLLIDLDSFKAVNDTYGHLCGDELIREAAHRLREISDQAGLFCARLGGDEFVILVADGEQAERIAGRVLQRLAEPVALSAATIGSAGSIGIALSRPGDSATILLREADRALYRAKGEGRNTYRISSREAEDLVGRPQAAIA